MSWRRLSLLIRHLWADPSSALFAAIKQSVAPPISDETSEKLAETSMYEQMQMLEWTDQHELLLGISNELRTLVAAKLQANDLQPFLRPWEKLAGESDAERNEARVAEYQSDEARAARAAVTGAPIPEPERR